MRLRCIIFLLLFPFVQVQADNNDIMHMPIPCLIKQLDQALEKNSVYVEQKETRINLLKKMLAHTDNLTDRLKLTTELSNEYQYYICDSAMKYIDESWKLVLREGNANHQANVMFTRIRMLLSIGMYSEALEILKLFQVNELSDSLKKQYYHCSEQTYNYLKNYAIYSIYREEYEQKSSLYLDSLLMITTKNSNQYSRTLARKLKMDGDVNGARKIFNELLEIYDIGTRDYSMVASSLSEVVTDIEERKRLLLLSAISDVMSAVKEYKSLRDLAVIFYNEGDIEHAYHYCSICMEDANFYNARHRSLETAQIQPIINRAYSQKIKEQHHRLLICLILISLMFVLLLASFLVLHKQNKKLNYTKQKLQDANNELYALNRELQGLNASLLESNQIKKDYLNRFMILSSSYITSLKQYQYTVYSKIVMGKINELKTNSHSTEMIDDLVRKFYQNFDEAFLTIYPSFMVDLNQLLRENERFELLDNNALPPEFRIFALMRLGITDTESIAKFLQYSTNTVYTYSTKIRRKAINKEDFNKRILLIG